ncbi:MAG: cellulase family glycosylhydrolase [Solirubrobacterales bacterium]
MGARALLAALVTSLGLLLLAATPARGFERAVPERFFGVSAPSLLTISVFGQTELRDAALDQIRAAGIDSVRTEAGWADVERDAPMTAGEHEYSWSTLDPFVEALALRGLAWMPNPHSPPMWARDPQSGSWCRRHAGVRPDAAADYGDFAGALARRYGRGGSFWRDNPSLPNIPVETYELWNEPNWTPFWCPVPDPETFAEMVAAAGNQIHAADPAATVAIGGLSALKANEYYGSGYLKGMGVPRFLERMTAAVPDLHESVDAAALHPYRPDPDLDVAMLGWFRRALERAGLGEEELILSEFGWNQLDYSEADRAEMISRSVNQLARTDCDLAGIYPHTWTSPELNKADRGDWWGMANPSTAVPYASGRAYASQIELFEGRAATAPPTDSVPVCEGDGAAPAEQQLQPPRVPDAFFGATLTSLPTPWRDRAQIEAMADANLGRARELVSWKAIEPVPETSPYYERFWTRLDDQFTLLGLEGIGIAPVFNSAPGWAGGAAGGVEAAYARFMGTVAERYGAGGAFWDENRHLDRGLAPKGFEVWSLANWGGSWWDGNPSASRYASMYLAARNAMRAVDPGIAAVASLSDAGPSGTAGAYIKQMVAARPQLRGSLDAVYVQTTSKRTILPIIALVGEVRAALDQTGNEDAEIHLGFGAPTKGPNALTEAERKTLYHWVSYWAPLSDCGLEGLFAFAWSTKEQNAGDIFDWMGIANPLTGVLSATGAAYRDLAALFTGLLAEPAPRATLHTCGGPAPDRDGDGFPDEVEDHPLDPELHP